MTKNIAIIGESCIDQYVYGSCDRVCPEAAAMCFKDNGTFNENLGMSANVYNNIISLNSNLIIDHITPKSKIIKKRFVDTKYNTIVFRQDINDNCSRIILDQYKFNTYDYIIISDYCKGFISQSDIKNICSQKKENCIVFMDTKKKLDSDTVIYVDFLKINDKEYKENIININIKEILNHTSIIVTKGEDGAVLYKDNKSEAEYFSTKKVSLRDVCGAGDTFLAGLVVKYIETNDIKKSIIYANECASIVVSKFGVVVP